VWEPWSLLDLFWILFVWDSNFNSNSNRSSNTPSVPKYKVLKSSNSKNNSERKWLLYPLILHYQPTLHLLTNLIQFFPILPGSYILTQNLNLPGPYILGRREQNLLCQVRWCTFVLNRRPAQTTAHLAFRPTEPAGPANTYHPEILYVFWKIFFFPTFQCLRLVQPTTAFGSKAHQPAHVAHQSSKP
jgi:hypothetical protein